MHLPIQAKPIERKRSYTVVNKAASVRMSDEEDEGEGDEDMDDSYDDMDEGEDEG